MSNLIKTAENEVRELILKALGGLVSDGSIEALPLSAFNVEVPAEKAHGDFSANIAMISAKAFRMPPRKIAELISSKIDLTGTFFVKVDVAGPGFLNFYLGQQWFSKAVFTILNEKERFGETDLGKGKKLMVEFVSANPTGPMHIGNARGGAIGDCLAAVLEKAGYNVTREFYVNDAGNQIEKFALSLDLRYLQLYKDDIEMPEDSYHGEDITEHARAFAEIHGDKYVNLPERERRDALVAFALPKNIKKLESDLLRYRIKYDVWFMESQLHRENKVMEIVKLLKSKGLTYEKEGADWYKATEFGAEKDDVLVRANGIPTYFTADIAYHYNKFVERNFDKVVNVWGADHHGHVARLKGAMQAVGVDPSRLDVVLMQMVRLVKDGEIIKASKRSGKAITLVTLLDEVPIDAARFFFNLRESNSHFDFDLGLAIEQSSQNPVYYVQYAHARICSILRTLSSEGIEAKQPSEDALVLLNAPEERDLIRHMATLSDVINDSALSYDPAKITRFAIDTATLFHKFYSQCRVNVENTQLLQARLNLCLAVKIVIKNILEILKINCPEKM
ncbi:MAG: arginine--tRNA ligase [Oscillospiraceae bacterium]|jgi:arginyl-tRNA synthetase